MNTMEKFDDLLLDIIDLLDSHSKIAVEDNVYFVVVRPKYSEYKSTIAHKIKSKGFQFSFGVYGDIVAALVVK